MGARPDIDDYFLNPMEPTDLDDLVSRVGNLPNKLSWDQIYSDVLSAAQQYYSEQAEKRDRSLSGLKLLFRFGEDDSKRKYNDFVKWYTNLFQRSR